jgi:hypothetical protein
MLVNFGRDELPLIRRSGASLCLPIHAPRKKDYPFLLTTLCQEDREKRSPENREEKISRKVVKSRKSNSETPELEAAFLDPSAELSPFMVRFPLR